MPNQHVIHPGGTLGVFGGGQLGRMFAQAATRLGYRVHVFDPDPDPPAAALASLHTAAAYDDLDAVRRFAQRVDAITIEFENVPADTLEQASRWVRCTPSPQILTVAQNRNREKVFLRDCGVPLTPFASVHTFNEAEAAMKMLGSPIVLKTVRGGYDGKGQWLIRQPHDLAAAWEDLARVSATSSPEHAGEPLAIAEAWTTLEAELSVMVARDQRGAVAIYGPIRNVHRHHILESSVFPGGFDPHIEQDACRIARAVVEALNLVGVCCIEMFVTEAGDVLVNEIAPRPHNSGHLTIEAHAVSQFEQQVRTLCGLPLGKAMLRVPAAAMVNLLGDIWPRSGAVPDWSIALAHDDLFLHLYGKDKPECGRKMGHLTAVAERPHAALIKALHVRNLMSHQCTAMFTPAERLPEQDHAQVITTSN